MPERSTVSLIPAAARRRLRPLGGGRASPALASAFDVDDLAALGEVLAHDDVIVVAGRVCGHDDLMRHTADLSGVPGASEMALPAERYFAMRGQLDDRVAVALAKHATDAAALWLDHGLDRFAVAFVRGRAPRSPVTHDAVADALAFAGGLAESVVPLFATWSRALRFRQPPPDGASHDGAPYGLALGIDAGPLGIAQPTSQAQFAGAPLLAAQQLADLGAAGDVLVSAPFRWRLDAESHFADSPIHFTRLHVHFADYPPTAAFTLSVTHPQPAS